MNFPVYNDSSRVGENGFTILSRIIQKELKWLLRKNHNETDFGIDAYLDIITNKNEITGKTIAVQIKTGNSFFKEENELGFVFRGSIKHLNYYLNHDIPVLIILVNDEKELAYWNVCLMNNLEKAGENWKLNIPKKNLINSKSEVELLKYITPIKDYASQLESFWNFNQQLSEHDNIVFLIAKEDIIDRSYENIILGIDRLKVNAELLIKSREKIDIGIHGYDNDLRELYEIPEVINWVKHIFHFTSGLSYFLAKNKYSQFLKVVQLCYMKYEKTETQFFDNNGIRIKELIVDFKTGKELLDILFSDLNEFTNKYGFSIETNKEITNNIAKYLLPHFKVNDE